MRRNGTRLGSAWRRRRFNRYTEATSMMKTLPAICFLVSALMIGPVDGQTDATDVSAVEMEPEVVNSIYVIARIVGVDPATRDVTLRGPKGGEITLTAPVTMKTFDNLVVGQQVNVQYVEALAIQLVKDGQPLVSRTDPATGVVSAESGKVPVPTLGREISIVADVVA